MSLRLKMSQPGDGRKEFIRILDVRKMKKKDSGLSNSSIWVSSTHVHLHDQSIETNSLTCFSLFLSPETFRDSFIYVLYVGLSSSFKGPC